MVIKFMTGSALAMLAEKQNTPINKNFYLHFAILLQETIFGDKTLTIADAESKLVRLFVHQMPPIVSRSSERLQISSDWKYRRDTQEDTPTPMYLWEYDFERIWGVK